MSAQGSDFRYFTTPIYYASGHLHAGHIFCTILTNIFRDHHLLRGSQAKYLTGMDEHGEKIERKAKENQLAPQAYVDSLCQEWKKDFSDLNLNYDIFLRTTSTEHSNNVKDILKRCYDNDDIYKAAHEGRYCVDCEVFLTPKEMDDKFFCLTHKKLTELRKEENYYFRLKKYIPQIQKLVESGKIIRSDVESQKKYKKELLNILSSLEDDLSISRPKTRTQWGIECPFDSSHVTYVWFDALPNYVTGLGGLDKALKDPFWSDKNTLHIIGREILKFHALYWPAMLLSAGMPLEKIPTLLVHGHLLVDGHKMSKSLGNVITPDDIKKLGKDAFVNTVFRTGEVADDSDVNLRMIVERYNADLANGVGNLFSRVLTMIQKYYDGKIPNSAPIDASIDQAGKKLLQDIPQHFESFSLSAALNQIGQFVTLVDKLISAEKPWELAKGQDAEKQRLATILASSFAALRVIAICYGAFFPQKMSLMATSLGFELFGSKKNLFLWLSQNLFSNLPAQCASPQPLFARMDAEQMLKSLQQVPVAEEKKNVSTKPEISIDDFSKIDIRVATIFKAEHVEGSTKLLKLHVQIGSLGTRQVFSGIKEFVKPEELVNRKVLVVCNLAPRKMKFGVSEAMLLTAEDSEKVTPLFVPEEIKEESKLV